MTQNKLRNVINVEEVEAFIKKTFSHKDTPVHIAKWFDTTFRRHMLHHSKSIRVVIDRREFSAPLVSIMEAVIRSTFKPGFNLGEATAKHLHVIDVAEHPEWVAKALAERQHVVYVGMPDARQMTSLRHMYDYMCTLPERDILLTYPHMAEAVKAWDRMLKKQKIKQALSEGVTELESAVLTEHAATTEEPLYMVRLVTKGAYNAEGAIMRHCVGTSNYFSRSGVEIYSLRTRADYTPIATIEIRVTQNPRLKSRVNRRIAATYTDNDIRTIVQVQGPCNNDLSDVHHKLVGAWALEQGFGIDCKAVDEDDDEWEEDEVADDDDDDGIPGAIPARPRQRVIKATMDFDPDEYEL